MNEAAGDSSDTRPLPQTSEEMLGQGFGTSPRGMRQRRSEVDRATESCELREKHKM